MSKINNYEKLHNMELEELAVFLCYQFINGFELLSKSQRFPIEKLVRDWMQGNDGAIKDILSLGDYTNEHIWNMIEDSMTELRKADC